MLYNFLSNKKKMDNEEDIAQDYFPSVTFLLPGWNESKNIATTIKSIQDLSYPKDKIEIFYLDNNSTDNTREIVESFMYKKDISTGAILENLDTRIKYIF